jgi:hypothetical protein
MLGRHPAPLILHKFKEPLMSRVMNFSDRAHERDRDGLTCKDRVCRAYIDSKGTLTAEGAMRLKALDVHVSPATVSRWMANWKTHDDVCIPNATVDYAANSSFGREMLTRSRNPAHRAAAISPTKNGAVNRHRDSDRLNYCIQYHNWAKRGLPWPKPRSLIFGDSKGSIVTGLPFVRKEKGSQVFLIVGLGKKPRRYFLWGTFTIADVEPEADYFVASGPGWMLNPPQELSGNELDEFRRQCANFVGFKNVSSLPYTKRLISLADKYHRSGIDAQTLKFCGRLMSLLPGNQHAAELRELAHQLERRSEASGTRGRTDLSDVSQPPIEPPKPGDEQTREFDLRLIEKRRGQPQFREALMRAYGRACALTGCDAEPALEAAHIRPFCDGAGSQVTNGLLLRADIHTLFDLGDIRIDADSLTVRLSERLRTSSYADLEGTQLRPPVNKCDSPDRDALRERCQSENRME